VSTRGNDEAEGCHEALPQVFAPRTDRRKLQSLLVNGRLRTFTNRAPSHIDQRINEAVCRGWTGQVEQ
jgi:hypothetical protein